jgi:superfamily II DNA or RNA helicase
VNSKELFENINTWDDFTSELENLNKKEKGDAFELLTKLYFKLSPKYSFYDEVWMLSEVPVSIIEELGIPSHDLGIDLIAKNENEYHAIQCKFHSDKNKSVTFKEVSTFISLLESNSKFTQGYICSSADVTSRNYNKLNTKPINLVLSDSWQELDQEFFENVRNSLNKKKVSLVPFEPRDHQKKALSEAVAYFVNEGNSRGKLIFPCGAGKSLTGFWMLQELKSKSTLIAVPSLSLVKQTLDVYLREIVAHQRKVKWLCICSDEGIGQDDDVVFYTENLGVPCQTDPEYIEQWLSENKDEEIVVFTTYQSGRIIGEISKKLNYTFDLGIFDEAHKTVGSDKKLFSYLLLEENISIHKRIFMTATERFYRGSKDDIISMDDHNIYGDTFTQMSFKEAIELGLLTDYKVITIDVKKSEIADFIKQNNLVQLNNKWKKETEARSLASMLALRKAMKQFPIKNAVSFHSSIEKAIRNKELQHHITDTYKYEPIDTYTVSGKLPTSKRNVIVQEFARSPKSLITNARCLTEGVDVPNIDCIVFSDPRKSKVDIVQALGRALRKKEGKDWGYVILPVIYDEDTHEIDNENFQEILSIVRGLASNDERIVEYFKDKNQPESNRKRSESQFQLEVFSEFVDESELSNQLQIRLWEKLSRFSWMSFEEAREYVRGFKLKSIDEYADFWRKGKFLRNIPSKPRMAYKDKGYVSMPDFLGYDSMFQDWLPYDKARENVRRLKLKNVKEWNLYAKSENKPSNIPASPSLIYKEFWLGWGDWLGTGTIAAGKLDYLEYELARKFVHNLKLKSRKEWKNYINSKLYDSSIPKAPQSTYKNKGWQSWGDFLGTGYKINRDWLDYKKAREFVKGLKLKSRNEWNQYCKSGNKPNNIPSNPDKTYKNNGWTGIGDWLGTFTISPHNRKYLEFSNAKEFVQKLKFKSKTEWIQYCKSGDKPDYIPYSPDKVYSKSNEWINYSDWLGIKLISEIKKEYLSFQDARKFVHKLKLENGERWKEYCKSGNKPLNIPSNPHVTYKNQGWTTISDWLNSKDNSQNRNFLTYIELKEYVKKFKITSLAEWKVFCKSKYHLPNIPKAPSLYYQEWKSWGDFLGTGYETNRDFLSYEEAKVIIHSLKLKNQKDWRNWSKSGAKPINIPGNPHKIYSKTNEWQGFGDWLGTGVVAASKMEFVDFETARNHARNLKLNSVKEWNLYSKSGKRPSNIPSNPQNPYKNKGWNGWADFLGKDKK